MQSGNTCQSVGVSISGATPSTWPTLNGNFHFVQKDKPPDDRSIMWRGKKAKNATNTVSISVSQPSGVIKWPNRCIVTNYFLLPMSLGGKSWQKHCKSHSNKICLDARRLVATRLQTLWLNFPLANYCWPSANCKCGLVQADEWNKVWLKAGARMSFHAEIQPISTIQN